MVSGFCFVFLNQWGSGGHSGATILFCICSYHCGLVPDDLPLWRDCFKSSMCLLGLVSHWLNLNKWRGYCHYIKCHWLNILGLMAWTWMGSKKVIKTLMCDSFYNTTTSAVLWVFVYCVQIFSFSQLACSLLTSSPVCRRWEWRRCPCGLWSTPRGRSISIPFTRLSPAESCTPWPACATWSCGWLTTSAGIHVYGSRWEALVVWFDLFSRDTLHHSVASRPVVLN